MNHSAIAMAWYSKEEYSKFQLLSDDPETWCETYKSWKANAGKTIRRLEKGGASVTKVPMTFSEVEQWCAMSKTKNISSTRSEYAAAKLRGSTGADA